VAQRLVRQACPSCAVRQEPTADTIERAGGRSRLPADGRWVAGQGCQKCGQTGLKGRIAIHEVLEITDGIRELITNRASEQAIRKAAKRAGMRTLFEDGVEKAAQGLTTLDELLRVVSPDESSELPVAAAAVAVANAVAPPAVIVAAVPQADTGLDPAATAVRRKVLVVDDSPTIASVVKYFLELEGFDVVLAADGMSGLETARREHPIMIVSDMNMPGMGGVEMIKTLRSDPQFVDVRILMLTSEASVECEAEGLEAGADDYILKPVEPRRLAARIKALLARSSNRAA
jgi:CheY-like chemotaxis protein